MSGHGGEVFRIARELGVDPAHLLDFSASINPLGLPESVRKAIVDAVDQIVHYPDSDSTALRTVIARELGLSPDQIVVGNGSTELIGVIPRAIGGVSGRGVIIEPAFSEYERGISASGRRIGRVTLSPDDQFALHLQPIEAELRKGCDLLVVANPGNPTGRYYPLSQMEPLVAMADRHGAVTLVDEAFIDFVPGGESALPLLSRFPRLLVLRSLTKFYALPGLRLGYVAAGVEIAGRVAALRDRWSVNTLAQAAGVAALGDHHYRAQTLSVIPREREGLRQMLEGVEGVRVLSGDANYLLLHLFPPLDPDTLIPALLRERILVRSCATFHGLTPRHVRVAVRSAAENRRLVEALRALSPP